LEANGKGGKRIGKNRWCFSPQIERTKVLKVQLVTIFAAQILMSIYDFS
jgi:hypothetical protein